MKILTNLINRIIIIKLVHDGNITKKDLDMHSLNAIEVNNQLLQQLVRQNENTEYGKKYHFDQIRTIQDYQRLVPLSEYDDYEPYISRMLQKGESGLLTNKKIVHYALSSGSIGVPKHIPVSQEEVDKYCKYGLGMFFASGNEYYKNVFGKSLHKGRGFNTVEIGTKKTSLGIPQGAISGTLLTSNKRVLPYMFSSPWEVLCPHPGVDMKYMKLRFALQDRDILFFSAAFMTSLVDIMDYMRANWEMLCDDIEKGRINPDIKMPEEDRKKFESMLKPDPARAESLRAEFKKGFDTPIVPRIWPNVKMIGSIGTGGFSAYRRKMRYYTGRRIPYDNVCYAASESMIAVARHFGDDSYVLLPDGGFYEFIPVKYMNDPEFVPLTMQELEEGEEYEIIVTNLSGLYRYRIKDVIRVTGFYFEAPLIEFVYRTNQMLSIAGEKTNEEAIRWSIEQFMKESGVEVNDFSVYADIDSEPGHYVMFMEPDRFIPKEQLPELRAIIAAKVEQANPSYGAKVRDGILGPMELIFEQQQTYQLYREMRIMKGISQNQLKPVRVLDTQMKYDFFFGLRENYDE